MADLFIIGQFEGPASITAVAVGSQIMHMLTVMLVGLAMGTTVSIAQSVGAGNKERAARVTGNTVLLFMGLSIVLAILLIHQIDRIVGVMATPPEAVKGTTDYLFICFLGIPFITAYNLVSSIFADWATQERRHTLLPLPVLLISFWISSLWELSTWDPAELHSVRRWLRFSV